MELPLQHLVSLLHLHQHLLWLQKKRLKTLNHVNHGSSVASGEKNDAHEKEYMQ